MFNKLFQNILGSCLVVTKSLNIENIFKMFKLPEYKGKLMRSKKLPRKIIKNKSLNDLNLSLS